MNCRYLLSTYCVVSEGFKRFDLTWPTTQESSIVRIRNKEHLNRESEMEGQASLNSVVLLANPFSSTSLSFLIPSGILFFNF